MHLIFANFASSIKSQSYIPTKIWIYCITLALAILVLAVVNVTGHCLVVTTLQEV